MLASLRMSGMSFEPIIALIFCTRSTTVTWLSLEKLNASPRNSGAADSFSARNR